MKKSLLLLFLSCVIFLSCKNNSGTVVKYYDHMHVQIKHGADCAFDLYETENINKLEAVFSDDTTPLILDLNIVTATDFFGTKKQILSAHSDFRKAINNQVQLNGVYTESDTAMRKRPDFYFVTKKGEQIRVTNDSLINSLNILINSVKYGCKEIDFNELL